MPFLTVIVIKSEHHEKAEEICSGIASKDITFKYDIKKRPSATIIEIESETKDKAHKRGIILTKKYFPKEGIESKYYKMEEKFDGVKR